ncbi:phosphopantetheine-binding protein [Streptomyces sp. WI04-05B]|uniref:phosphopantetheine-binding protein n=1 Tax=Streptomyces TaxID=1883 RepID=UPI0029B66EE0|nr:MULTISPECIES: phosphopantetheine-binding protein [unclassified Streptomyces]MDX2547628.1 phosphopantetheine-binding protein [Streptomyces sp. WI04-05B]MDX2590116.1 phosphopantetheine-binding protein [Streptomyces sp. WI04-05A]MDX3752852.1 phosphopantetheine-binding protein [Streptomyces sp. AK08-02]
MSDSAEEKNDLTGTERTLAKIWQDLLGPAVIGPDDNFFALGGRSLQAMTVVVQVRRQKGAEVRLADVFRAPTLGSFAELIDKKVAEQGGSDDAG